MYVWMEAEGGLALDWMDGAHPPTGTAHTRCHLSVHVHSAESEKNIHDQL
jgi:hypothetical protein